MAITRTFRVNLGNTFPPNTHQAALDIIIKIEESQFRVHSKGLGRNDVLHGEIVIRHPSPQSSPPFMARVEVTFFDENTNADPLDKVDEQGRPETSGTKFRHRKLPSYPTDEELKGRAEGP